MEIPPPHVLAQLDAIIVGQSSAANEGARATSSVEVLEEDEDQSVTSAAFGIESSATSFSEPVESEPGGARTTSSRFWGVSWHRESKKWKAAYRDADGKTRYIGHFDDEEEAARARDQAIRDAGLQGKRHMNVDATGALVPKRSGAPSRFDQARERSAVVAPDPAHDPTAPTSKFWGVSWENKSRRWKANYNDADGKNRHLGLYDTQEAAAHAVNAAIRRAGLEGRRKTNPVVDGQLVPRALKARGHGPEYLRDRKRGRHDESPAATPSTRARRPRRAAAN